MLGGCQFKKVGTVITLAVPGVVRRASGSRTQVQVESFLCGFKDISIFGGESESYSTIHLAFFLSHGFSRSRYALRGNLHVRGFGTT